MNTETSSQTTTKHTDLFRMINDAGDLLCVTFQDGHDLLRVLVEDDSIFVITPGNNASSITQTDVKGKDAGHTGTVYALGVRHTQRNSVSNSR